MTVSDRRWRSCRIPDGGRVFFLSRPGDPEPPAATARPVPISTLLGRLQGWLAEPSSRQALVALHDQLFAVAEGRFLTEPGVHENAVRSRLAGALESRRIVGWALEIVAVPPGSRADEDEPAPVKAAPKRRVEFDFEYPDGSPVSGLSYVLRDPANAPKNGKLPSNGILVEDPCQPGTYSVTLKEVEEVHWARGRARADEEVKIRATVTGYPPGTKGRVNIYREHRETKDAVVDTVDAEVKDDKVEIAWKLDPSKDSAKDAWGVHAFVAELVMASDVWGKTERAIELELPEIADVRWSAIRVASGEAVSVAVETIGLPDGTEVKLELWAHGFHEDDTKVKDLPAAKVKAGKAIVELTYADGGEIDKAGEYFVVAKADRGGPRQHRSGLVWCRFTPPPPKSQDGDEAAAPPP